MARDWSDLFVTDAPPAGAQEEAGREAPRRGLFRRLRENLTKTREALGGEIQATLFGELDAEAWERL
ncbi:MAG TPA: signal recognition particle-docking protein FtsY, partial [Solirubrobacteraceae bacterium]|nr:signal recognition particle-docking protein FtsY [Solirubrobacteraceae bacterium]